MNILIAEDSSQKIKDLRDFFVHFYSSCNITVKENFSDSLRAVLREEFDLVILDMSMPSKEKSLSYSSRTLAGKDILDTVNFRGVEHVKFIIFSQFSEFGRLDNVVSLQQIYTDLKSEYKEFLIGFVKYDSSTDKWKDELRKLIEKYNA